MWLSGDSTGFVNQRRIVQRGFESLHRLKIKSPAWVVELVDTRDLKSLAPKGRAGSIPASTTKNGLVAQLDRATAF